MPPTASAVLPPNVGQVAASRVYVRGRMVIVSGGMMSVYSVVCMLKRLQRYKKDCELQAVGALKVRKGRRRCSVMTPEYQTVPLIIFRYNAWSN